MKQNHRQPNAAELERLTQLFGKGLLHPAEKLARTLTNQFPTHGFAWKVLSVLLLEGKNYPAALEAGIQATKLLSQDASTYNNLGTIYQRLERFDEAELNFREALVIAPGYAKALYNLAGVLRFHRRLEESEECCRSALVIDPIYVNAHLALGSALELQNRLSEARTSYKAALELSPDMAAVYTDVLHLLSLDAQVDSQQLLAEHQEFGRQFEFPLRPYWPKHNNVKDPNRHLRVGFVTGDLYNHALANFLEPLFKFLTKKSSLALHIYYTNTIEDEVTRRLRAILPNWHDVAEMDAASLAEKVHADGIDILIDLAGHTVLNRLLTFARKPAPVQASWLGYLGTTGLQAMDYYICDPFWIPLGELDWQFTEMPAYLPAAFVFQPNPASPPINELPALRNGQVTFGSFNRHNKINNAVITLWSKLMRSIPNSRMVLAAIPPEHQEQLTQNFEQEGINNNRLTFFPRSNQKEYLECHLGVDFCLDTFPHGGGATTAHAAWMGVPTLCLAGESPASRFGATAMHHLGLDGFIANSIDDFIEKGLHWATHICDLSVIRQEMRSRFNASPIGQPQHFVDNFERLLRGMWLRWCKGNAAAPLYIEGTKVNEVHELPSTGEPPPSQIENLDYLYQQGRYDEAELLARQLVGVYPEHGFAWKILGGTLHALGKLEESLSLQKEITVRRPEDHEAHFNLACEFQQQGLLDDAIKSYVRALGLQPSNALAYCNLGNIFQMKGLYAESEHYAREAIALNPSLSSAHNNLGNALHAQGKLIEAQASYEFALSLKPDWAEGYNNLAITQKDRGLWNDAKASYAKALQLSPNWAACRSNLLYCLAHDVSVEPQALFEAHRAFGARFEPPLQAEWCVHDNDRNPERHLHIGFVSGDFFDHALTNFLEPVFRSLSRHETLFLHAYSTSAFEDAVTQRFRPYFIAWNSVSQLDDAALAQRIRADGIDILIDLTGHTANNRLLTFARKPAPIQVSWLGYLGTSGLQAMDYYLCDRFWIPLGELDWQFTEKLAYLPSAVVFEPNPDAPPINLLPALSNGNITFGSFNRTNKLNDSVIVLWSMLMRELPTSKMVLGGIPPDSQVALLREFEAAGIEQTRLTFLPRTNTLAYLALHHHIDFCLDTFPHGGGATTAHAAWMGVPSLSLAGESPTSRFGATLIHHLGLDGFIATSIEDYIQKGCYWAMHLSELSDIRSGLRERFLASPLGKPEDLSIHLESALRLMWKRWCKNAPLALIDIVDNDTPMDITNIKSPPIFNYQESEALIDLYSAQRYEEAAALAHELVEVFPDSGLAWKIIGSIFQIQGDYEACLPATRKAIFLNPDDASNHNNLGVALMALGQLVQSEESFQKAISIAPHYSKAIVNLAESLLLQGKWSDAQATCLHAIELDPNDAAAYISLGKSLEAQGMLSEAQASYYRADMAHEPRKSVAHSNVLYLLTHDVLVDPVHLHKEHAAFGDIFESPLRASWAPHDNHKDGNRVLKIGFVSGDFHHHALNGFLEPAFKALSTRPGLELWAYSTDDKEDDVTQRMRSYFSHWVEVADLADEDLATKIRKNRIDILIDLSGHTAKNRLLTFARKPAPIQISWLGYLGTTGLTSMDYYLCDPYWIPPKVMDWQFSEKLAYIPNAVVFEPDTLAPPVSPLPALKNRYITYASFNRVNKINDSVIALWSMVMQQVPISKMVLVGIETVNQAFIIETFATQGIHVERLEFYPRLATAQYMALHQQVDICLDTFPYGGGATTAHAAWMGVPTLCLAGENPASRFSASLMQHLDLSDFVAESIEEFVAYGVSWAERIADLALLRSELRQRFSNSLLGQSQKFAEQLELRLREAWTLWCEASANETIEQIDPSLRVETQSMQIAGNALAGALVSLAHANEQSGDFVTTACLYTEALKITPKNHQLNYQLGLIKVRLKDTVDALPFFESAIQLQPQEESYWIAYIDALIATGALETATSALEWGQKYGLSLKKAEEIAANCVRTLEKSRTQPIIEANDCYTEEELAWPAAPSWPENRHSLTANLDYIRPIDSTHRRYVIYAPLYRHNSAGIRVMYDLQKWLLLSGHDAIVIAGTHGYDTNQFAEDIVIYPEVVAGNPLNARRVVRYILNVPGKLGGSKNYAAHELLVAYSEPLAAHAQGKILNLPTIEPFFCKTTGTKSMLAVYVGKGVDAKLHPKECIYITRDFPSSRRAVAELLQQVSILYTYDDFTAIELEALLCGCTVKVIHKDGSITELQNSFLNSQITPIQEVKAQLHDFIEMTKLL